MACDQYFNSVVSLLHFDGSDGSTTFTDVKGKTWTANGNAQIDTAQSKFGGASGLFDGAGDYITTPDSADFAFGAGDFTVEFRLRPAAVGTTQQIIGQWISGGTAWHILLGPDGAIGFNSNGVSVCNSSPTLLSNNTWYAVAVSRVAGTAYLFINGALADSASDSATYPDSADAVVIGRNNDSSGVWYYNGHIDDLRITKGVGRYAGAYTPDSAAFPESQCIDLAGTADASADAAGTLDKTISVQGTADAAADASGALTNAVPVLEGALDAAADASGDVSVGKNLAGTADAAADAAGALGKNLAGAADASADAAGALGNNLAGTLDAAANLSATLTNYSVSTPILLVTFLVNSVEQPSMPITFAVTDAVVSPSLAVTFLVNSVEQPSLAVNFAVVSNILQTATWTLTATLGGVDVSSRLTGQVDVRMEEGGSRQASFSLHIESTPVNPLSYVGKAVALDLVRTVDGVQITAPLFRGVVEYPTYEPRGAVVRVACSQDLQHIIAALPRATINLLTGGGYHRAVHGEIDDNWDYAQACMETRPASLDCDVMGAPRVTNWAGLPIWRTLTTADIDEPDIGITFPRRADLVNRVNLEFEYRYFHLRERHHWQDWSTSYLDVYKTGPQYPTVQDIESAFNGSGWQVVSGLYFGFFSPVPYRDGYIEIPSTAVSRAQVHIAQRHTQNVTEASALVVEAPSSITNNGVIAHEMRGALASEWNPDAWESDISAPLYGVEEAAAAGVTPFAGGFTDGYGRDGTSTANSAGTFSEVPNGYSGGNMEMDWSPDAPRADAEAGIETLINKAKTKILSTHRLARVSGVVDILPELDTHLALGIDIGIVQAQGKVASVTHTLDIDAGSAITAFSIAVSGIGAAGVVVETAIAAPAVDSAQLLIDAAGADTYSVPIYGSYRAGLTPYNDNLMGWLVNPPKTITLTGVPVYDANGAQTGVTDKEIPNEYYTPNAYPVSGFRAQMPGVDDARRNPAQTDVTATYTVAVPENVFTI